MAKAEDLSLREPPAYALRVYADTSNAGYYSPLHEDLGCASLVPIPDPKILRPPPWLDPDMVVDDCTGAPLSTYMPLGGEWPLHRDPRLDLGFYTEPLHPRGRMPRFAGKEWIIVFIAGLAVYPRGFWERRRRKAEIVREFRRSYARGLAGVYAVALLDVEAVLEVQDWRCAPKILGESPHRVYGEPVRAFIGRVAVIEPPAPVLSLPLADKSRIEALKRGRFRKGLLSYRRDLLDALVSAGFRVKWAGTGTSSYINVPKCRGDHGPSY